MKIPVRVPDYLPRFQCKCGACRHSCCHEWPIALTEDEYFHLLGMDCSPSLRRRLDIALHVRSHPFPENYAELSPNWLGICPLQRPDGLCALQCEKGEAALPLVCRLFPRSIKTLHGAECVCAGSCEAVLEQLYHTESPLRWVSMMMDVPMEQTGIPSPAPVAARDGIIALLQDRSLPLKERIRRLPGMQVKEHSELSLLPLIGFLSRDSAALQPLWEEAQRLLGDDADTVLRDCRRQYEQRYPMSDVWLEQALVNHVMRNGFPEKATQQQAAGLALGVLYALLRFYGILLGDTFERLVDVHAAVFRRAEHSNFDSVIEAEAARFTDVIPLLREI